MLVLLSPAKTLDTESRLPTRKATQPRLLPQAEELIGVMRTKTPDDIAGLMGISADLASLNAQRYAEFATPLTGRNARPAALTFAGDVYQGMAAGDRFDERDWTEAQKTVRILSGLFGVLRPLDLMQPYRLEMGIRLATDRGQTLYDYWGDTVTDLLREDLAASPGPDVVIDLASQEYSKVIRPEVLDARVITPRFLDDDGNGRHRMVSFFAKKARGEMAAWVVQHRVRSVRGLRDFAGAGYRYAPSESTPDAPTYLR